MFDHLSSVFHLLLVSFWVFCGVGNTISYSVQNEIFDEKNDSEGQNFTSSLVVLILSQQLQMFTGMFLFCFPFYLAEWIKKYFKKVSKKNDEDEEFDYPYLPPRSFLAYILLATLDLLGSSLISIGLYYSVATTTTMMRDSGLIFSALLSLVIRRDSSKYEFVNRGHKILGLLLILSGSIGVFLVSPDRNGRIGGFCLIAANFVYGCIYFVEEHLFSGRDNSLIELVSMEGLWGMILSFIILLLIKVLGGGDLSSAPSFLSKEVAVLVVVIGFYNLLGNSSVVLLLERSSRVMSSFFRVVLLWFVQVVVRRKEDVSLLSISSYLVVFVGVLIYNAVNPVLLIREYLRKRKRMNMYKLNMYE